MRFIVETLDELSDKPGPIDPRNGWPTHDLEFIIEASSLEDATRIAEEKWPGNIMAVYEDN